MSYPPPPPSKKKNYDKAPQDLISEFWKRFNAKNPGKITSVFPPSLYENLLPPLYPHGASSARNAAESYEAAAKSCREKVNRIVRECNRTNEKFTDPDFDIENDKFLGFGNCLAGLDRDDDGAGASSKKGADDDEDKKPSVSAWALKDSLSTLLSSQVLGANGAVHVDINTLKNFIGDSSGDNDFSSGSSVYFPGSVHRLDWIFDSPHFVVDGYSSSDIKQGANGDCWWLAAVATICNRKDLMEKVCVARDEDCGVYGFVFYRDGDWISTVVDDNLYLAREDFDYYGDEYDSTGKKARQYRRRYQTGSEALHFAKCVDPNETWLPLLEKAYAKVHGDYEAISGGWSGEAVEDMTGGVTTTVATNRVLRKDKLWKELANPEKDFVFAASAIGTGWDSTKSGLALGHAYSILRATEEVDEDGKKVRLVLIRNPWGERAWNGIGEWSGPWSDGSKEWTPYWMKKLNHTFGDDGVFWMSYEDLLETFLFLHRTRLFDDEWTVVQRWTSVNIAWVTGYLRTKFVIEIKKAGPVVIVLSQLDERYWTGLEGQYDFALHFLLQEVGAKSGEHLLRVRPVHSWENRSVSAEIVLEPGKYEVLPKILATRDREKKMVEDVVKEWVEKNPQKLRQVGMSYDLAHAKGGVPIVEGKKKSDKPEKVEAKKEETKPAVDEQKAKGDEVKKESSETKEEVKEEVKEETKKDVKDEKKDEKEETKTEDQKQGEPAAVKTDSTPVSKDNKPETSEKKEDDKKDNKKDDKKDDDKKGDDKPDEEKKEEEEDEEEQKPPWNAVCVISLRVYAKDPSVSIVLTLPNTPEDAAVLEADGASATGATM